MRTLTALLLLALALPAGAQEPTCETQVIDHHETTPWIVSRTEAVEGLRSSIIGHFLVVEVNDGGQQSYDLSDPTINGATLCLDGTVAFTHDPEPVISYEPAVIVDVDAIWWDLIE